MAIDDGGPAFPFERSSTKHDEMAFAQQMAMFSQSSGQDTQTLQPHIEIPPKIFMPGMSLRDWFAGMIIGRIIHRDDPEVIVSYGESIVKAVVKTAFVLADEMIAQRNKDSE